MSNFTGRLSHHYRGSLYGVPLVLAFAAISFFGFNAIHAATYRVAAEAESGVKSGNAVAGDTTGASGGAAVKFSVGTPSSSALKLGIDSRGGDPPSLDKLTHDLHATWTRVDFSSSPNSADKTTYDRVTAAGLKVLPIIYGNATAYATAYPQLNVFEWGNEPYSIGTGADKQNSPSALALSYKNAVIAVRRVNPGARLLLPSEIVDSAQTQSQGWGPNGIDEMFQAVPDLAQYIGGIAVHPYGYIGQPKGAQLFQFERIDDIHDKFTSHGVNAPVWVTEIGWSTTDRGDDTVITSNFQALRTKVAARPWIEGVMVYQSQDQKTGGNIEQTFGIYHTDFTPKPQAAVVKSWFNSP